MPSPPSARCFGPTQVPASSTSSPPTRATPRLRSRARSTRPRSATCSRSRRTSPRRKPKLIGCSIPAEPDHVSAIEKVHGRRVCHRIYLADATGSLLNFPSARSLVRVRRTVTRPDGGTLSDDSRYFVSNIDLQSTKADRMMALVRSHWRCENNGHLTSDAILGEDRRRVRFARTPQRIAATAICRMIAQNILGQLRNLSRTPGSGTRPSWCDTIFHTIRALTGAVRHRSTFEVAVFP